VSPESVENGIITVPHNSNNPNLTFLHLIFHFHLFTPIQHSQIQLPHSTPHNHLPLSLLQGFSHSRSQLLRREGRRVAPRPPLRTSLHRPRRRPPRRRHRPPEQAPRHGLHAHARRGQRRRPEALPAEEDRASAARLQPDAAPAGRRGHIRAQAARLEREDQPQGEAARDLDRNGQRLLERHRGGGLRGGVRGEAEDERVRGGDEAVGAGPEGEGDVLDDGGAGEREAVEQEHWDSEDAHAEDAEFVRHSRRG